MNLSQKYKSNKQKQLKQQDKILHQQQYQQGEEDNQQNTEVYVFGSDIEGQLGLGNQRKQKSKQIIPKKYQFNLVITQIACGENHSAFITNQGLVYTMGSNQYGKLGIGNMNLQNTSTPSLVTYLQNTPCKQISCGQDHTVAITNQGTGYAWGRGEKGQIGNGLYGNMYSPSDLCFPSGIFLEQTSCGNKHTLVLDSDGNVYACGANESCQLGLGLSYQNINLVQKIELNQQKIQKISAGNFHSLFLSDQGDILACGNNKSYQLGMGHSQTLETPENIDASIKFIDIAAGAHSAAISEKGDLFIWGTGVFGKNNYPTKQVNCQKFHSVQMGDHHGCAIDQNNYLYSWGQNSEGQLGLGDMSSRQQIGQVKGLEKREVIQVACGTNFTISLGQKRMKISGNVQQLQSRNIRSRTTLLTNYDKRIQPPQQQRKKSLDYNNNSKKSQTLQAKQYKKQQNTTTTTSNYQKQTKNSRAQRSFTASQQQQYNSGNSNFNLQLQNEQLSQSFQKYYDSFQTTGNNYGSNNQSLQHQQMQQQQNQNNNSLSIYQLVDDNTINKTQDSIQENFNSNALSSLQTQQQFNSEYNSNNFNLHSGKYNSNQFQQELLHNINKESKYNGNKDNQKQNDDNSNNNGVSENYQTVDIRKQRLSINNPNNFKTYKGIRSISPLYSNRKEISLIEKQEEYYVQEIKENLNREQMKNVKLQQEVKELKIQFQEIKHSKQGIDKLTENLQTQISQLDKVKEKYEQKEQELATHKKLYKKQAEDYQLQYEQKLKECKQITKEKLELLEQIQQLKDQNLNLQQQIECLEYSSSQIQTQNKLQEEQHVLKLQENQKSKEKMEQKIEHFRQELDFQQDRYKKDVQNMKQTIKILQEQLTQSKKVQNMQEDKLNQLDMDIQNTQRYQEEEQEAMKNILNNTDSQQQNQNYSEKEIEYSKEKIKQLQEKLEYYMDNEQNLLRDNRMLSLQVSQHETKEKEYQIKIQNLDMEIKIQEQNNQYLTKLFNQTIEVQAERIQKTLSRDRFSQGQMSNNNLINSASDNKRKILNKQQNIEITQNDQQQKNKAKLQQNEDTEVQNQQVQVQSNQESNTNLETQQLEQEEFMEDNNDNSNNFEFNINNHFQSSKNTTQQQQFQETMNFPSLLRQQESLKNTLQQQLVMNVTSNIEKTLQPSIQSSQYQSQSEEQDNIMLDQQNQNQFQDTLYNQNYINTQDIQIQQIVEQDCNDGNNNDLQQQDNTTMNLGGGLEQSFGENQSVESFSLSKILGNQNNNLNKSELPSAIKQNLLSSKNNQQPNSINFKDTSYRKSPFVSNQDLPLTQKKDTPFHTNIKNQKNDNDEDLEYPEENRIKQSHMKEYQLSNTQNKSHNSAKNCQKLYNIPHQNNQDNNDIQQVSRHIQFGGENNQLQQQSIQELQLQSLKKQDLKTIIESQPSQNSQPHHTQQQQQQLQQQNSDNITTTTNRNMDMDQFDTVSQRGSQSQNSQTSPQFEDNLQIDQKQNINVKIGDYITSVQSERYGLNSTNKLKLK